MFLYNIWQLFSVINSIFGMSILLFWQFIFHSKESQNINKISHKIEAKSVFK